MRFKVGDQLFIPVRGVGVVRDIAGAGAGGSTCVLMLRSGLKFSAPVAELELRGVRALIPARAVSAVYEILGSEGAADRRPWSRKRRDYAHRVATGDPLAGAVVVRDLARLGAKTALTVDEREIHDQARALLVQELAAVRDVAEEVIEDEIGAILGPEKR